MATDKQLIQQTRKGDSEAYGRLFSKYYQQIYSVCQQIARNPHDAEEVTSETFIHAYLKLNQLKDSDKFSSWLKEIARNCSRDFLRGKQKDAIPLSLATEQASTQASPDKSVLKQELIEAVMEAVSALPPKDREVVRAYIDGLNHTEISERLDISAQASMNRLHRARKKIKARVKELLNAIIGLPNTLSLEKIISGGIVAMKIGISTKVTIGVIGAIVAGFIGFEIATRQPDVELPKVVTQQQINPSKDKRSSVSKMNALPNKSEKEIQYEQYSEQELEEALKWLDSLEKESSTESESNELLAENSEEIDTDGGMADKEVEELSSELQRKVEIYAELAKILPEYGRVLDELERCLAAHDGVIKDDNPGTLAYEIKMRHGELFKKILNLCEPFLGPPAIIRDERGDIQAIGFRPALDQIAEYLGKELPFDGNSDYFSAEDYQGGT